MLRTYAKEEQDEENIASTLQTAEEQPSTEVALKEETADGVAPKRKAVANTRGKGKSAPKAAPGPAAKKGAKQMKVT